MATLAREGMQDIDIRTQAVRLCHGIVQKNLRAEACTVLNYVRDRVRYVRDIRGTEVLQIPRLTMQDGGDCDDKAMLIAALLGSIGHATRFVAVAYMANMYSHVWVQTQVGRGVWLDLEATEPLDCGQRVPIAGAVSHLYQAV